MAYRLTIADGVGTADSTIAVESNGERCRDHLAFIWNQLIRFPLVHF